MKLLQEYITKYSKCKEGGIIIVNNFLNHRMDIKLIDAIGKDFYDHFKETKPTLVLTIEASGIGIACLAARYFGVPVLFAKKSKSKNMSGGLYSAPVVSFTKGGVNFVTVCSEYISKNDRVLIIDDFLAEGNAVNGLLDICKQAGAQNVGVGICIEKYFLNGGKKLREAGVNLYSQAVLGLTSSEKIELIEL